MSTLSKSSDRKRIPTNSGETSNSTHSGKHSLSQNGSTQSCAKLDNTLFALEEYSSEVPLEQINWSWQAYAALDGLLCLYKEPDQPSEELIPLVKRAIVGGLNAMPHNPERHIVHVDRLPLRSPSSPEGPPAISSQRPLALNAHQFSQITSTTAKNVTESVSQAVSSSDSTRGALSQKSDPSEIDSLVTLNSEHSISTTQSPLPCTYVVHTEPDWSDSRLGTTFYVLSRLP